MNWIELIIIVVLLALLINEKRKTKVITQKLKNIIREDSRERVKINSLSKAKQEMVSEINILLDNHQRISIDNKNYKEQHKKMISNISHDIRTPLTALVGYIHLLMDDSLSTEKKDEYIGIIYERSYALQELTEEFFQMAKLEGNDVELQLEKVNISEVIRQNIISFMNEINEKQLKTEINIGEEEVFVYSDKNALQRIITNLISNSLKYGYEGNVIGIDLRKDEEWIKLSIWDRGRGIDENELPYIFDRLYTAEKSRNRKFQGSGLGLAIVKKLVESMDGKIEVSSIPYEKTIFTIILQKSK